jgi:hypothetical protein
MTLWRKADKISRRTVDGLSESLVECAVDDASSETAQHDNGAIDNGDIAAASERDGNDELQQQLPQTVA